MTRTLVLFVTVWLLADNVIAADGCQVFDAAARQREPANRLKREIELLYDISIVNRRFPGTSEYAENILRRKLSVRAKGVQRAMLRATRSARDKGFESKKTGGVVANVFPFLAVTWLQAAVFELEWASNFLANPANEGVMPAYRSVILGGVASSESGLQNQARQVQRVVAEALSFLELAESYRRDFLISKVYEQPERFPKIKDAKGFIATTQMMTACFSNTIPLFASHVGVAMVRALLEGSAGRALRSLWKMLRIPDLPFESVGDTFSIEMFQNSYLGNPPGLRELDLPPQPNDVWAAIVDFSLLASDARHQTAIDFRPHEYILGRLAKVDSDAWRQVQPTTGWQLLPSIEYLGKALDAFVNVSLVTHNEVASQRADVRAEVEAWAEEEARKRRSAVVAKQRARQARLAAMADRQMRRRRSTRAREAAGEAAAPTSASEPSPPDIGSEIAGLFQLADTSDVAGLRSIADAFVEKFPAGIPLFARLELIHVAFSRIAGFGKLLSDGFIDELQIASEKYELARENLGTLETDRDVLHSFGPPKELDRRLEKNLAKLERFLEMVDVVGILGFAKKQFKLANQGPRSARRALDPCYEAIVEGVIRELHAINDRVTRAAPLIEPYTQSRRDFFRASDIVASKEGPKSRVDATVVAQRLAKVIETNFSAEELRQKMSEIYRPARRRWAEEMGVFMPHWDLPDSWIPLLDHQYGDPKPPGMTRVRWDAHVGYYYDLDEN